MHNGFHDFFAACVVVGNALADTVTSVNVVGYQKITISAERRQIVAVPMHKLPSARGVVTDNTFTSITDDQAQWQPGQFAWGVAGQEATGQSFFYVEIDEETSALDGRHFYVTNNTATELMLVAQIPEDLCRKAP